MTQSRAIVSFDPLRPAQAAPLDAPVQDALQRLVDEQSPTVAEALGLAAIIGGTGIRPGVGRTGELWQLLATIAAHDLGTARAVEPHLDALAILAEAGQPLPAGTWGVFAAEAGPAVPPLRATPATGAGDSPTHLLAGDDGSSTHLLTGGDSPTHLLAGDDHSPTHLLIGEKPWCSLADRLDAALVSATLADGVSRQLFAVDLRQPGVEVLGSRWHARGLAEIPSGPVRFVDVSARAVGEPGWYLSRPGFSWGGIGVAACWFGGAVGVARALFDAGVTRRTDPILLMHLGAVDALLADARRALAEAAALVDAGAATGEQGTLLAQRVRATVARASEAVHTHVAHALGPAPLARDAAHAKRVADLELYLRQHHAEKDEAALGADLVASEVAPW
ncbi:acyl-CoA dehydrogenase [Subtercola sp. YIM 133946]|uniref:acyl-CoA dehydrogenase n=1 Tax=Subtercola sp. YIM 133946 TaxID=3118909 RepID=UPI002F95B1E8